MAQLSQPILNQDHDDLIHGVSVDYYGRRLATCSSDKTVKIYDVENGQRKLVETLRGHEGPVWSVAWAHPKYGTIVASASFDGRILIWRLEGQQWTRVGDLAHHSESINSIAWAPHDIGCFLACASSDGGVSVYEFLDSTQWDHSRFTAHALSVNGVSWAPDVSSRQAAGASSAGSTAPSTATRKFVTGSSDKLVRIWEYNPTKKSYDNIATLSGHQNLVRDVAWSPSMLSKNYIASASQDKTVRIWTSLPGATDAEWTSTEITFDVPVWGVDWSPSGNVLAVSSSDNRVSLWKEKVKGGWEVVKSIEE